MKNITKAIFGAILLFNVAAFVTSYAGLKSKDMMEKLDEQLLHYYRDSAILSENQCNATVHKKHFVKRG